MKFLPAQKVKRLVAFFLIFLFCLSPLIPLAYAQTIQQNNQAQNNPALLSNTNPDVPKNLHTHTQSVMIEVMASMICQLTGRDVINRNQTCLGVDQQTGKIGFAKQTDPGKIGGAIGIAQDVISMTFTPPINTGDYVNYLAQNFGIAKPALAQTTGTGFDSLSPIMNLWVAFRNLVYFFFIAVFIILGFGIMLRVHMDPRTVMTISNQLPGIIVAILLVTFSFAISGLLIDLMWTSIYITSNVITSVTTGKKDAAGKDIPLISQETAQGVIQSTNALEAANFIGGEDKKTLSIADIDTGWNGGLARIADAPATAFANQMPKLFDNPGGQIVMGIAGAIIGVHIQNVAKGTVRAGYSLARGILNLIKLGKVAAAIPTPATFAVGAAATVLDGIFSAVGFGAATWYAQDIQNIVIQTLAFLVIAIAILWALFRLAFELIRSYIFILLDVVFAPFWILGGLIPGSSIGFGAWLREIISHLSVFPVTIGMFLLGSAFMKAFGTTTNPTQFTPPMIGNSNAEGFAAFIGLGIILMTPQVLTMMKELIKAPSFKQAGSIAGAVGFGLGAINIPQHMQKLGSWGYYAGTARDMFGKGIFGRKGSAVGGGEGAN